MASRDQRVYREAAELWRTIYGEPPPKGVDASEVLDALLKGQEAPGYERFASPHLRRADVIHPRR